MNQLKTDLCIIGAGAGGLAVASVAAQLHVPTVLIEAGKMGGDCLNYGCVPSKSLIAAAKVAHAARGADQFGVTFSSPAINFKGVYDHVHQVIDYIAPMDSAERFQGLGATVIREKAHFVSPTVVKAGDTFITARRFVLATGSSPMIPPILGLKDVPYLTNETLFDLKECPDHLIIIGGGPIGVEMAQAFVRLGAKVTVLEAGAFFPRVDEEFSVLLRDHLESEGVEIRTGSKIREVGTSIGQSIWVDIEHDGKIEKIKGSHLLVATGRQPNVEDLGLEIAGIDREGRGIQVDAHLRTTNKRVYAMGDVVGQHQFTHVATYHAGIIIQNCLFRIPATVESRSFPAVTYTDPELATVGISENEATQKKIAINILRWPYFDNDRAVTERKREGLIKVITTPKGTLLGATIFGASAGEMISLWQLAVHKKLHVKDIAQLIVPYPTYSEVSKRAASTFFAPKLFGWWARKLVWLLSKFG